MGIEKLLPSNPEILFFIIIILNEIAPIVISNKILIVVVEKLRVEILIF